MCPLSSWKPERKKKLAQGENLINLSKKMADCYLYATFTPKAEYNGTIDSYQAFVYVPWKDGMGPSMLERMVTHWRVSPLWLIQKDQIG